MSASVSTVTVSGLASSVTSLAAGMSKLSRQASTSRPISSPVSSDGVPPPK